MFYIKKGLNIPIKGNPRQYITENTKKVTEVAMLFKDYQGTKAKLAVSIGDNIKRGQLIFTDKKDDNLKFTSIAGGKVTAICRGEKRALLSIIIKVDENEKDIKFKNYDEKRLKELSVKEIKDNLILSGLWTSLRSRPFNKIPKTDNIPSAIFINTISTAPLSVNPEIVINKNQHEFCIALSLIKKLTKGITYVCKTPETNLPIRDLENIRVKNFCGKHPAGLVGTHIHYLHPTTINNNVWTLNYQDLIAIGKLFISGELNTDRIISIAGSKVKKPCIITTRVGANIDELLRNNIINDSKDTRKISGSVLYGRTIDNMEENYLGRYDLQVSIIEDNKERELLGYIKLGINKFSIKNAFCGGFLAKYKKKLFNFSTNLNGSSRPMVPINNFESVMGPDIEATPFLKSLLVGDIELAKKMGCLDLAEEDMSLFTFVCPSKYDYAYYLRKVLNRIEQEGA